MKQLLKVLALATLLFGSSVALSAQNADVDVDEVIEQHIDALGGYDAIKGVKSIQMEATIQSSGPLGEQELTMATTKKHPNMVHQILFVSGMEMTVAFDGETGWMINPFMGSTDPEEAPAEQIEQLKEQMNIEGDLVDYEEKGNTVKITGVEEAGDASLYKIEATKPSGDVVTYFIDSESFLEVKREQPMPAMGLTVITEFSDFRDVGGMVFPHAMVAKGGAQGDANITFTKIEVNGDVPDSLFAMPGK